MFNMKNWKAYMMLGVGREATETDELLSAMREAREELITQETQKLLLVQ